MTLKMCRLSRLARIFSVIMALHIFNLSMDGRDANPDSVPEDLTFNDIESITEFFAEVVFNFTNAFEEHDEADTTEGGVLDFYKFYCSPPSSVVDDVTVKPQSSDKFLIRNTEGVLSLSREVVSPPPKA
jgi:hypothetical protein